MTPEQKTSSLLRDTVRGILEILVVSCVAVALLKSFVADMFVIPTGSMATTLLGNHLEVTCPQCSKRFLVDASGDLELGEGNIPSVQGCLCVNCQYHIPKQVLDQLLGR